MSISTYKCILFYFFCILSATAWATKLPYGMVVTSQHLATEVGKRVLMQGGNAIDAAVAVGYALSVVEPCCGNIGGGGFMLIHFNTGKNIVVNFRERAPIKANKNLYLTKEGKPISKKIRSGYLSVAVPGTVMGLNTALANYGTLSLKKIISPAISLARRGFILVPGDIKLIAHGGKELLIQPPISSIFSKQGHPLKAGDRLVQKDLANTLEQIASGGSNAFYKGEIAAKIIKASNRHGGLLTKQDFSEYTIDIQQPVSCNYKGYTLFSAPPPSTGGTVLCEMLNITQAYPLSKWGYRTPLSMHYTLEAMRSAYQDRNQLGDPDFVTNPVDFLLSPAHIKAIQQNISPFSANKSQSLSSKGAQKEKLHTTHYSIVDKQGNAVSVTYTLNGPFGAKVMPGKTGIFLNNEMDDFNLQIGVPNTFNLIQASKNSIQPRKRPLSSMTPTIVLKNHALFMVLGAPGGSTIPTQVLETIQNVIDYHLNLQIAIDVPRYHMQYWPDLVFMEARAFSEKTISQLKKMRYQFKVGSPFNTPTWGAVAAIMFNEATGRLIGAIDRRRPEGSVGVAR